MIQKFQIKSKKIEEEKRHQQMFNVCHLYGMKITKEALKMPH